MGAKEIKINFNDHDKVERIVQSYQQHLEEVTLAHATTIQALSQLIPKRYEKVSKVVVENLLKRIDALVEQHIARIEGTDDEPVPKRIIRDS